MDDKRIMERFSVLMSVYKGSNPDFFEQSLQSLWEQTCLPSQIVLIKDGPINERIDSIISKFQQLNTTIKFTIIEFKINVGLGVALAKGVHESDYELIARMDSDDIAVQDRFKIQLKMFEQNSNLDLAGGQLKEFSGELKNLVGSRNVPLLHDDIVNFAKKRSPFNHPTVMFKKSAILNIGNYVDYRGLEDYHLWIRAINRGLNLANSPEDLLFMRVENDLYSRRGGIDYLRRYYKLKDISRKLDVGNFRDEIYCDFLMTMNVLSPIWIRKLAYRLILHRK